jgi:site-specific DNA recombinase
VLYGYRWNADRSGYEPDPETAPVVRRIFSEALSGVTLRGIAANLTRDGIPTAQGRDRWRYTTIAKILQHPRYSGTAEALRYRTTRAKGHTANGRPKRSVELRPEDERVTLPDGRIPPLVDRAVFDAIQQRLRLNQQPATRNATIQRTRYSAGASSDVATANG